MRINLFLLVTILIITNPNLALVFSQKLSLNIRLDKQEFLESEAIWFFASVVNNSSDTVKTQELILSADDQKGIRYYFYDKTENKRMVRLGGLSTNIPFEKDIPIPPGDSIYEVFDLPISNAGIKDAPSYLHTQRFLKSGEYEVFIQAFTGNDTIYSNLLSFSINKPKGKELNALKLLNNAEIKYSVKDYDGTISECIKLIKLYPSSVYLVNAHERLIFISRVVKQDVNSELTYVEQLVMKRPNHVRSFRFLKNYSSVFIKENKEEIFQKIVEKFPNSKVGLLSKKKIQEIKMK